MTLRFGGGLVIENDERSYCLQDCLRIHDRTGVPVLFDTFHHSILNHGEDTRACLEKTTPTWGPRDGIPMVDYSSQAAGRPAGSHAPAIEIEDFRALLRDSQPLDFDIMLEIKDKEASALKAVSVAATDGAAHGLSTCRHAV